MKWILGKKSRDFVKRDQHVVKRYQNRPKERMLVLMGSAKESSTDEDRRKEICEKGKGVCSGWAM